MQRDYNKYEFHIINLFNQCKNLTWKGKVFNKISACKPRSQGGGGEPKTDVYIFLESDQHEHKEEIKISLKQNNSEFLANKLTAVVAEDLLGSDWSNIIQTSVNSIKQDFLQTKIVYLKEQNGREDAYFTLGWKLEVTNKPRKLSSKLDLPSSQIVDIIYRGMNQPINKKNAIVFDNAKNNSGVAEYLLEGHILLHSNVETVIKDLKCLDGYIPNDIYLVFTANNYRLLADKADGPRALAVAIKWNIDQYRLKPEFIFNNPLMLKGETDMMPIIKLCLEYLDFKNIKELDRIMPL